MPCFSKKIAVGGATAAMAATGATAVIGTPTVIVGVLGWVGFAGTFGLFIAAALDLKECLERAGNQVAADKLAEQIERMQAEMLDIKRRLGLAT